MSQAIAVEAAEATPEFESSCPDCGSVLANVQGISDCVDCSWTND